MYKLYIYNYKYIQRDICTETEKERFVIRNVLCDYKGCKIQNLPCGPGGSRPWTANGAAPAQKQRAGECFPCSRWPGFLFCSVLQMIG